MTEQDRDRDIDLEDAEQQDRLTNEGVSGGDTGEGQGAGGRYVEPHRDNITAAGLGDRPHDDIADDEPHRDNITAAGLGGQRVDRAGDSNR